MRVSGLEIYFRFYLDHLLGDLRRVSSGVFWPHQESVQPMIPESVSRHTGLLTLHENGVPLPGSLGLLHVFPAFGRRPLSQMSRPKTVPPGMRLAAFV